MIKKRSFCIVLLILLFGCKNHYYEIRQDKVFFYLNHSEAQSVQLRCSIDGFKEHPARRVEGSLWEASVPLSGDIRYFYLIDQKVYLPSCQLKEEDDFGTENCIFSPDM